MDEATPPNATRVLAAFGAPVEQLTREDLASPGVVFQIGVEPVRIDFMTSIDAVAFGEAWTARVETTFSDQPVHVLSRTDLVRNERASGRLQDLTDIESLGGDAPG